MFECLSLNFNLVRKCCSTQQNPNRNVIFKHRSIAVPLEDNTCFPVFIDEEASENCMKKRVILDKMHHFYICKDDLFTYPPERKYLWLSSQYYHQRCGIAQGSNISTVRCNLCLGHIQHFVNIHNIWCKQCTHSNTLWCVKSIQNTV